MLEKVCFDILRVPTSRVCRSFHVTRKQHYARAVKRRTIFPRNINRINAADVSPPQPPTPLGSVYSPGREADRYSRNKLDDIPRITELLDDGQFE